MIIQELFEVGQDFEIFLKRKVLVRSSEIGRIGRSALAKFAKIDHF
jgi:hypothetical protein